MKKSILLALAGAALLLSSCNDMLDVQPRDKFIEGPDFWNSEAMVESYSNSLYENYVGYGVGGNFGWFYFKSLGDDQVSPAFDDWAYTTVPGNASEWSTPFTEIRRINYLLTGLKTSTMDEAKNKYFQAVGRLNRAWEYYQLVRAYGDVQWYEDVVLDATPDGPDASLIYQTRTDRDVVMDNVLADLDFAISVLPAAGNKVSWSKDMALAMKADICLFEGTYCKYRTQTENGKAPNLDRANKFLNECVKACEAVMAMGYELNAEYGVIYNAPDGLNSNTEVIFFRNYEKDVLMHSTGDYTCSSSSQRGISKDAFDAFLFTDGKPLATTTMDKSAKPEREEADFDGDGNPDQFDATDANGKTVKKNRYIYSIKKMLEVRDKRLSHIVDPYLSFTQISWERSGSNAMQSSTGYTIAKYDCTSHDSYNRLNIGTQYTDAPLYTLPIIYLNYAEAKAELGTLTQSDLDNTVNKLQARAGLPNMTTSPAADPANNHGVSALLWEIRRARRCELMTDNWIRYWDLVRWHQLDKLDTTTHPSIVRGAYLKDVKDFLTTYFADCPDLLEAINNSYNLDADGYVIGAERARTYDKKYYFYPIPSNQITDSRNTTTQNPGW